MLCTGGGLLCLYELGTGGGLLCLSELGTSGGLLCLTQARYSWWILLKISLYLLVTEQDGVH